MKNTNTLLIIIAIVIIGGVLFFAMNKSATTTLPTEEAGDTVIQENTGEEVPPEETVMTEISVALAAQNDSGEEGTATLVEQDGRVIVTINLAGAPETEQPAHIHAGACPQPGAVVFPLASVVNGVSETIVEASMEDLRAQMPLAVNVHKSADEVDVYVACGDLAL